MAKATKRQTESALRAIRKKYGYGPGDEGGPRIVELYHGWYSSYPDAIVWEEGPFEWAILASEGGFDEELYYAMLEFMSADEAQVKAQRQPVKFPQGTYAEPISSYALCLYTL